MRVIRGEAVYVHGASAALLDKLLQQCNVWSSGEDNVVLAGEEALTVPELAAMLDDTCRSVDVVVCK